jgi:hypothetical protein
MKAYVDDEIAGVTGNSSWNESHADTLYYGIDNPYSYYNETNKQPVSNYTEDEIEAFIFDDDNTAELNMSGYNITGIDYLCMNSDCSSYMYHNGTGIVIQG